MRERPERPEWLKKKIRAAQKARKKRDPHAEKLAANARRQAWLMNREFRAITDHRP